MGFRHRHVPAPSRHLFAARALGWRHVCTRHGARHHRQSSKHNRQRENPEFANKTQRHQCTRSYPVDATVGQKFQITPVTAYLAKIANEQQNIGRALNVALSCE
jgi:hypothetical protein